MHVDGGPAGRRGRRRHGRGPGQRGGRTDGRRRVRGRRAPAGGRCAAGGGGRRPAAGAPGRRRTRRADRVHVDRAGRLRTRRGVDRPHRRLAGLPVAGRAAGAADRRPHDGVARRRQRLVSVRLAAGGPRPLPPDPLRRPPGANRSRTCCTSRCGPATCCCLCTDGIAEQVPYRRLAEVLGGRAPADMVGQLVADAAAAGGSDNATAVVVAVSGDREAGMTQS